MTALPMRSLLLMQGNDPRSATARGGRVLQDRDDSGR